MLVVQVHVVVVVGIVVLVVTLKVTWWAVLVVVVVLGGYLPLGRAAGGAARHPSVLLWFCFTKPPTQKAFKKKTVLRTPRLGSQQGFSRALQAWLRKASYKLF